MDKAEIVAELRRAALLQMPYLSQMQFKQDSHISTSTVENKFGRRRVDPKKAKMGAGVDRVRVAEQGFQVT